MEWTGGIGNRISVSGRLVEQDVSIGNGRKMAVKKFITSSTIKGTSDITCTAKNGRTFFIEIKTAGDKPRKEQIAMQTRIRKMGGVYEFVSDMQRFYEIYDLVVSPELFL